MLSVQVPTPTQATLIDYSETIIVVVAMIYFGGQHRPSSSDLLGSVFKLFKLGRLELRELRAVNLGNLGLSITI